MSSLGLSFVRFSELTPKATETRLKGPLGHDIIPRKHQRVEHTRRVQGKHRKKSCIGLDLSPTKQFPHKGENSPPPHLLIPTHAPATPLFPRPNGSSSFSALPLPSTLSTHPRLPPAHSALFPTQTIFFVFSTSPTLRTNSPASSPTLPHSFPDQRRTKQGIPSHGHRVDRRKGYLQAIVFYMYLRTALAQHTPNSTGLRQDPKERWQSGRLWRSRKPLSCKAPGVRIPLSPQRGFKVTAKWSSEKPSKQE